MKEVYIEIIQECVCCNAFFSFRCDTRRLQFINTGNPLFGVNLKGAYSKDFPFYMPPFICINYDTLINATLFIQMNFFKICKILSCTFSYKVKICPRYNHICSHICPVLDYILSTSSRGNSNIFPIFM